MSEKPRSAEEIAHGLTAWLRPALAKMTNPLLAYDRGNEEIAKALRSYAAAKLEEAAEIASRSLGDPGYEQDEIADKIRAIAQREREHEQTKPE